jgi:hypothetical protein
MTTFEDKLFALIHGLPVANEPITHLASGPSEPGAFQKFHEQIVFDHLMGKRSEPVEEIPAFLQKLMQPRDSREQLGPAITLRSGDFAKRFGEPITPARGGDLAKRASDDSRKVARIERTHFSTSDVVAEFDADNHVIRTYIAAYETAE